MIYFNLSAGASQRLDFALLLQVVMCTLSVFVASTSATASRTTSSSLSHSASLSDSMSPSALHGSLTPSATVVSSETHSTSSSPSASIRFTGSRTSTQELSLSTTPSATQTTRTKSLSANMKSFSESSSDSISFSIHTKSPTRNTLSKTHSAEPPSESKTQSAELPSGSKTQSMEWSASPFTATPSLSVSASLSNTESMSLLTYSRTPNKTATKSSSSPKSKSLSVTPLQATWSSSASVSATLSAPTKSVSHIAPSFSVTSSRSLTKSLSRAVSETLSNTTTRNRTLSSSRSAAVSNTASVNTPSRSMTAYPSRSGSVSGQTPSPTRSLEPTVFTNTSSVTTSASRGGKSMSESITVSIGSPSVTRNRNSTSKSGSRSVTADVSATRSLTASDSPSSVPSKTSSVSSSLSETPSESVTVTISPSATKRSGSWQLSQSVSRQPSRSRRATLSRSRSVPSPSSTYTRMKSATWTDSMSRATLSKDGGSRTVSGTPSWSRITLTGDQSKSLLTQSPTVSSTSTGSVSYSMSVSVTARSLTNQPSDSQSVTVSTSTTRGSKSSSNVASVTRSHSVDVPSRSLSFSSTPTASKGSPTRSSSAQRSHSIASMTTSLSGSVSKSVSAIVKSRSLSDSISLTKTRTKLPTPSPSRDTTITKSLSEGTITLAMSETRSLTRTPTATKSFEQLITTTVPLVWKEIGYLRFLRRPTVYAAPFRAIPIAPTLIFQIRGAAAVASQTYRAPIGLRCYMRIISVETRRYSDQGWNATGLGSVYLDGVLSVPMIQSVCVFPNFVFKSRMPTFPVGDPRQNTYVTPEFRVTVRFCANTSLMLDPRVPVHPCNTSTFVVASCPIGSSGDVFEVRTNPSPLFMSDVLAPRGDIGWSIFTSNRSGSGDLVVELTSGSFEYNRRNTYSCSLLHAGNRTVAVPLAATAWLTDLCHLRCVFSYNSWSSLVVAPSTNITSLADLGYLVATNKTAANSSSGIISSGLLAGVSLVDNGVESPSQCMGQQKTVVLGAPAAASSTSSNAAWGGESCILMHQTETVQWQPLPLLSSQLYAQSSVDLQPTRCYVRVLGFPDPAMYVVSTPSARTSLHPATTSVAGNVTVSICDAVGNPIPLSDANATFTTRVYFSNSTNNASLSTSLLVSSMFSASTAAATGTAVGSVWWSSNIFDRGAVLQLFDLSLPTPPFGNHAPAALCSTPGVTQGYSPSTYSWYSALILEPQALFGPSTQNLPLCVEVQTGIVVGIQLINAAEIAKTADTAVPLYVTPLLVLVDALGNTVPSAPYTSDGVRLETSFTIWVSLVQVSLTQSNAIPPPGGGGVALHTEINGVWCDVLNSEHRLYRFENISSFPAALDQVIFMRPGENYSLLVEAVQSGISTSFNSTSTSSPPSVLSTVLWSDNATDPFPSSSSSIRVYACDATLSNIFSVENTVFASEAPLMCNASSGINATVLFNNTLPLEGGSLWVYGHNFDYMQRQNMYCHVSNWQQLFISSPFTLPHGAVPAQFVSSCMLTCQIPPQPFAINPASTLAYNPNGQLVASSTLAMNLVGQLRVRVNSYLWSAPPIGLKVVGLPAQMDVAGWNQRLQNRVELTVPGFTVRLLDATGNDLGNVDFSSFKRVLTLSFTPQKSLQLNGSSGVRVSADTCSPQNGVVSMPSFVIFPTSGDYPLTLSSPGLSSYILLLTIFDNITINHDIKFLSPFPLCFVTVQLDRSSTDNGQFPVSPTIGVFSRNISRNAIDTGVSDVRVMAVINRAPGQVIPAYEAGLVELGVGLTDCNSDYNNCGFLDAGQLTFGGLRFTGIPGIEYVVTMRAYNSSVNLRPASFFVRVPLCPVNTSAGNLTAALVTFNSSLRSPVDGVLVKGWKFPIPDSIQAADSIANLMFSCLIGNSGFIANDTLQPDSLAVTKGALMCSIGNETYPGIFEDICTAKCFMSDMFTTDPRWVSAGDYCSNTSSNQTTPAAVTTTTMAPPVGLANTSSETALTVDHCCFDASFGGITCDEPVTSTISIRYALASSETSSYFSTNVGSYTFIGPVQNLVVLPNVLAVSTIFYNQQIQYSSASTKLDSIIVSLVDQYNNELGNTAPTDILIWLDGYAYAAPLQNSPLLVPGNSTQQLLDAVRSVDASQLLQQTGAGRNATFSSNAKQCTNAVVDALQILLNGAPISNRSASEGFPSNVRTTIVVERVNGTVLFNPPRNATVWHAVDGAVSLDGLTFAYPPVGVYIIPIYAVQESTGFLVSTNATVYITPGKPVKICLAVDFSNTSIANNELLDPQPKIYLVDASNNVYQSLRSNPQIVSSLNKTFLLFDNFATTVNISYRYQLWNTTMQTWIDQQVGLSPNAEYGGGIDVVQYLFNGLKVSAVHSVDYRLMFYSSVLGDQAQTPNLVIKKCDVTQYAISNLATCVTCPRGLGEHCIGGSNANCFSCNGSTSLNITGNYWRYASYSEYAYNCPSSSCQGNTELGTCLPGYLQENNPLCGACEVGYAKDFLGSCVPCASAWVTVLAVVVIIVVIAVIIFAFIYLSVKGMITDDENDNHLVMMLKIFMNYAQVAGMLSEFKVNFTGFVMAYFNFVGAAAGGSGVSISPVNCMMPHLTFLDKMSAQLLLPVLVLVLVAVCLGIMHVRRIRKERRIQRETEASLSALQQVLVLPSPDDEEDGVELDTFTHFDGNTLVGADDSDSRGSKSLAKYTSVQKKKKQRNHVPYRRVFGNASMILIFVLYQSIVTQCIATFNCQQLFTGRTGENDALNILDVDVRVPCQGSSYESGLSIAMYGVFIYAVFLPMFTMIFVLHQARHLGWKETYMQFSFLIQGFRLKYWFWEFVVVFRKVGLRLLIATVTDPTLQALLGIWFLTALFVIQTYAKPYVLPIHNHADQLSLMTALITLNIGLAFSTYTNECSLICGVFSVLLIISNIGVIFFFAGQIVWGAYLRVVEEFGIDTPTGERWISLRNLKNILYGALKRQHKMSPSFKTYTPRPLSSALARSVFGERYDDAEDESPIESSRQSPLRTPTTYQPPQVDFGAASPQQQQDGVEMTAFPTTSVGGGLSAPKQDYSMAEAPPMRRYRRHSLASLRQDSSSSKGLSPGPLEMTSKEQDDPVPKSEFKEEEEEVASTSAFEKLQQDDACVVTTSRQPDLEEESQPSRFDGSSGEDEDQPPYADPLNLFENENHS